LIVEFVGEAQIDEAATMNVLNGSVQLVYIRPDLTVSSSGKL